MKLLNNIWRSPFLIKLRSWEYWPFGLVYAPIFVYWIWLSIKARSLLYFTASNPSIENGGMLGESKIKILNLIPDELKPITLHFSFNTTYDEVIHQLDKQPHLQFPVICKPDIGERGWLVKKITNKEELKSYVEVVKVDFLIQEYLDLPIEMGVFYYRYPGKDHGCVSSVVVKEMLTVTGDGHSTLEQLILNNDRAKLQWKTLKNRYADCLGKVLEKNDKIELVSIGNHCKGTKFLDGNHLINDTLNDTFDTISHRIEGFYFGRYDIRVRSIEDLYMGKLKIMELNGAGSEPAHVYQPGYSFWKAIGVFAHHWKVLYKISILNHKKGVPYLSFSEGLREYRKARNLGNQ